MRHIASKVAILVASLVFLSVQAECFITQYDPNDPTVIVAAKLPLLNSSIIDTKLMAYVGNGHLASTVFDTAIYVNGLYNGARGVSHRARLPNMHNFQIRGDYTSKQYILDMKNGVFVEQLENDQVSIERRIFAHQYYNRLLVTQVVVKRQTGATGDIPVFFDYVANFTSEDFKFDPITSSGNTSLLKGQTIDIEFIEFQKTQTPVFVYFTPIQDLNLTASQDQLVRTFVSSIDMIDQPAKDEMGIAMSLMTAGRDDELFRNHTSAFNAIWDTGRIQLDNLELQRTIYSSYYYLLSSVPAISHNGQLNQFYGLSPGSLSRGSNLTDYQGHSFWDTETWMYPSVLMFYPNEAKEILSYRIHGSEAAAYNAKLFNTSGWRYPWESAFTSLDVTPDCCPEVKLYQLHISGDIAYAARQYLAATRDMNWLQKERGGELITRIAEFWASRISYSSKKSQYEILGVLPPDEDAQPNVNNSVYTNIIAALSIYHANYTNCLLGASPFDSSAIQKARCLHLPFDDKRQIHLEYEGYNGKLIKQADVVLIGFPLMWPMDYEVRKNDLYYYENLTRSNGPAMTWGMHAIGHIELGDYAKAAELLNRSYTLYVKEPFSIWTEAYQDVGAINFITGAGGFLQTLIFGYGGLRLHVESLRFRGNLPLPPQSSYLYLHKIKYLGSAISFNHTANNIQVIVNSFNDLEPLVLETPSGDVDLKDKNVVNLPKNDVEYVIRSKVSSNCPLPYDKIDLKMCSDVNASRSLAFKAMSLSSSVLAAIFVYLLKL